MNVVQDGQAADIRCDQIEADFNYRRRYDPAKMASLRADIRARGLISRVVVRALENDRFQLVVGNRRYRAFVEEFGTEALIKAEIRTLNDEEATAMMMAENGEREDPSVIEDAEGAARMVGLCKGNREEAANRLGWPRSKLDRRLGLMNATQTVRDAYLAADSKLQIGHVEVLAALRKEVQDRVINMILQGPPEQFPTVDRLKAMAETSLQLLESAIFDRVDCGSCHFNTGNQQALFDNSFSGSRCTNKECFDKKTEGELESRKGKLAETYQVVRIVRAGDNSTVIPLRAEGKRAVGAEQAIACGTCADYGACVSALPDSLGKTFEKVCFNQSCNEGKVKAFADLQAAQQRAAETPPQGAAVADATGDSGSDAPGGTSDEDTVQPGTSGTTKAAQAKPDAIRNAIREYREEVWRLVFQRAVLKLDVKDNRALLIAIILNRPGNLDSSASLDRLNKGLNLKLGRLNAGKLAAELLTLDQGQLASAFQQLPAHLTKDTPIEDIKGFLKALKVNIEHFWQVNDTFFDLLTKTELDAVCQELGLDKAAGKTYASLKNGSKKEFVAAMLKVQGFAYQGAVPKIMRWTSGI